MEKVGPNPYDAVCLSVCDGGISHQCVKADRCRNAGWCFGSQMQSYYEMQLQTTQLHPVETPWLLGQPCKLQVTIPNVCRKITNSECFQRNYFVESCCPLLIRSSKLCHVWNSNIVVDQTSQDFIVSMSRDQIQIYVLCYRSKIKLWVCE